MDSTYSVPVPPAQPTQPFHSVPVPSLSALLAVIPFHSTSEIRNGTELWKPCSRASSLGPQLPIRQALDLYLQRTIPAIMLRSRVTAGITLPFAASLELAEIEDALCLAYPLANATAFSTSSACAVLASPPSPSPF
jgi:hypothetical protein